MKESRKSGAVKKAKYLGWLIGMAIVLFITTILAVFFADTVLSKFQPLHYLLYLILVFGIALPILVWLLKKKKIKKA